MKNRNDQKKFIFAQLKKLQVQRLYKKLQEISKRKKDHSRNLTQSQFKFQRTQNYFRIPKNQDEVRKFQIHKQNERLVDRLGSVKSTVCQHIVVMPKKVRNIRFNQILKSRAINQQNQRLAKVISDISISSKIKYE